MSELTENKQNEGYTPKFDILYEDNHIIVVQKPQMTACCPDESKDDNLLDQIKAYIKTAYNKHVAGFVVGNFNVFFNHIKQIFVFAFVGTTSRHLWL